MFKKVIRHLVANKTFSLLNVLGLATGIACSALIFLWVEDELNYNSQFANKDRLYCILENQKYEGQTITVWSTPGPLGPASKAEVPGITNTARMTWQNKQLFTTGDKSIYQSGSYVDPAFLTMFSIPFIQGNATSAFSKPHSIVITEAMAGLLFGNSSDAIGKTVTLNNKQAYTIAGVVNNMPTNSSFSFKWLLPFTIYEQQNSWIQTWGNNGLLTYVELAANASMETVNKQLAGFIHAKNKESEAQPFLHPLNHWRLYSAFENGKPAGGSIKYVKIYATIAWLILLIACINFMNLSTAQSEKRAREVGVRKVIGARRNGLILQYIGESLLMAFLSALVAIVLVYLCMPAFNLLVHKQLSLSLFKPLHLLGLACISIVCGIVAGSYPAFYLSSFNPIQVLKGYRASKGGASSYFRKGLVVFQFAISIILIICTITIYQQIKHTRNRQLGYNKDNLLIGRLEPGILNHFNAVRQDLINSGVVSDAAMSNQSMIEVGSNGAGFSWSGDDKNKSVLVSLITASPHLIGTMGMQLKSGRDFYDGDQQDSNHVIINEEFARIMGKYGEVGQYIERGKDRFQIIGVIKSFLYNSPYFKPDPLIIFNVSGYHSNLLIRLASTGNTSGSLARVEKIIKQYEPGYPFEYQFATDAFDGFFANEKFTASLAFVFAALAIMISCLGLFGLAAFSAEQRKKEIGIRKVLGASVSSVTRLLSKEFMLLILISFVISFPLSWWYMHQWLQGYQYRIQISPVIFLAAGLLATAIALATVSFQSIKAAFTNPVKSLRT